MKNILSNLLKVLCMASFVAFLTNANAFAEDEIPSGNEEEITEEIPEEEEMPEVSYFENDVVNCTYNDLYSEESATFEAQFTPVSWTMAYLAGEGVTGESPSSPESCEYASSCVAPVNTFSKTGYTFDHWDISCMESDGETECIPEYSNGNPRLTAVQDENIANITDKNLATITLSPAWNANTFNVQYSNGDDESVSGEQPEDAPTSCTYDGTCDAPDNFYTKEYYHFNGWGCTKSDESSCTESSYAAGASIANATSTDNDTITLTPIWEANTYIITINKNGGAGSLTVNGVTEEGDSNVVVTCTYGETVTLPEWGADNALVKGNSVFTGWSQASVACDADKTITAQYEACAATAGTNVESVEYANNDNNTCTYNYSCKLGYHVGDTQDVVNSSYAGTAGTASGASHTSPACNANGVALTYVDGETDLGLTPATCTYGGTFNLPEAPAKKGYIFKGWTIKK